MIEFEKMTIWGKELHIKVTFDCYEGEEITPEQKKALRTFLSHTEWIDKSKQQVLAYCVGHKKNAAYNINADIFECVMPRELYLPRDQEDQLAALLCDFSLDPEHGLAIVFDIDGNVSIGSQDIVL